MDTENIPKRRLTRRQVGEALKSVPMQSILMGAQAKDKTLTSKQLLFAEQIALGNSKAGAYRAAYESHGKPVTQSRRGQEVASLGAVQAQIDAFRLAIEAQKHATPSGLRALVIERLTCHALDAAVPPAQRLRALELLGKITEVALFTERREIIKTDSPAAAREKLIGSLRAAIQAPGSAAGAALLAELRRGRAPMVINHDDSGLASAAIDQSVDDAEPASADAIALKQPAPQKTDSTIGDALHPPAPTPPSAPADPGQTLA